MEPGWACRTSAQSTQRGSVSARGPRRRPHSAPALHAFAPRARDRRIHLLARSARHLRQRGHPQEAARATPDALARLAELAHKSALHRHRRDWPRLLPRRKSRHRNPERSLRCPAFDRGCGTQAALSSTAGRQSLPHAQAKEKVRARPTPGRDLLALLNEPIGSRTVSQASCIASLERVGHARRSPRARLLYLLRRQPHLSCGQEASARPLPSRSSDRILVETDAPFLAPIAISGGAEQRARSVSPIPPPRSPSCAALSAGDLASPDHRELPRPLSHNQQLEAQHPARLPYTSPWHPTIALTWSAKSTCRK